MLFKIQTIHTLQTTLTNIILKADKQHPSGPNAQKYVIYCWNRPDKISNSEIKKHQKKHDTELSEMNSEISSLIQKQISEENI